MAKPKVPRRIQLAARREMVVNLRKRGFSCAEIGQMLHPQCSRQAVSKMLHRSAKNEP